MSGETLEPVLRAALPLAFLAGCQVVFPVGEGDGRQAVFVQSTSEVANGVVMQDLPLRQPVEAEDLIVVVVGTYGNDLVELRDTSENSYLQKSGPVNTFAGGTLHILHTFASQATDRLTISFSGMKLELQDAPQLTLAAHVYRGIDPDTLVSKALNTGEADPPSTTIQLAKDTTLAVAAMTRDDPRDGQASTQVGPGLTQVERPTDEASTDVPLITADRFSLPAGAFEASFTMGANASWAVQLITFE